jgi:hypothetical protein
MLAYITGTVDQELLLRNEYLVAENQILKAQLKGRLRSDGERANLGESGPIQLYFPKRRGAPLASIVPRRSGKWICLQIRGILHKLTRQCQTKYKWPTRSRDGEMRW